MTITLAFGPAVVLLVLAALVAGGVLAVAVMDRRTR